MKKYCCFALEDGITMLGWGQLNAALFFWARFSTFEPYYMWIDMWTAIMFTIRTVFFFIMRADENSDKTKKDYFEVNKATVFGLIATALATVIVKWLEWGNFATAAFPLWPAISWALWTGTQVLNWFLLKSYCGIDKAWGTMINEEEQNGMLKKDDDLRTKYNANAMD